jgi:4-hydroxybenzoate polyprenyltransferase
MGPRDIPLCVDLDGTLIRGDMTVESIMLLLARSPLSIVLLPWWLMHGLPVLKREVAQRVSIDVADIPINANVLELVEEDASCGRNVLLVSGSDEHYVRAIADRCGVFTEAHGSDGKRNLAGETKRRMLVERFGEKGFDYIGNSRKDLTVWKSCRNAIVVDGSPRLIAHAQKIASVEGIVPRTHSRLRMLLRTMRPRNWIKNLLLFVPIALDHQLKNPTVLGRGCLAFAAFTACTAAIYLINDACDIVADRHHPTKRNRPIAAGFLPLSLALGAACILLITGAVLGLLLPFSFLISLLGYVIVTFAYSFCFKRWKFIDVLTIALCITMRIVAGTFATGVHFSPWLIGFSLTCFLSLALIKRLAEIRLLAESTLTIPGRGYRTDDTESTRAIGVMAGAIAISVLAFYLQSDRVHELYRNPEILWIILPVLLFWMGRLWIFANRGWLRDDPLLFATRDWTSYICGLAIATILLIAS